MLELVAGDPDLAALPATSGRRADDGDPDGERHAVEVDADGVRIRAGAPEGIFRGLATLLQVIATTPADAGGEVPLPSLNILDAPRFAWRGFSFDVVRTSYTVDEVKRVIDLIALYKANVLHLHLTDAEGWRIEIDAWPKLAEVGGKTAAFGRPGRCYTKAEYREIVQYAADRFITVVPEFEMPGHTAAIFAAYPELAGDGTDPGTANVDKPPWFQVLHPDNPRIFPFLTDVLTEIAELTPGAYIHIGGDEALGMDADLYRRFMEQAKPIVYGLGKKVVAWQEAARAGFQPGDIAQLWISPGQGEVEAAGRFRAAGGVRASRRSPGARGRLRRVPEAGPVGPWPGARPGRGHHRFATVEELSRHEVPGGVVRPGSGGRSCPARDAVLPEVDGGRVLRLGSGDDPAGDDRGARGRGGGRDLVRDDPSIDDVFFLVLPRLPGVLEKGWSAATPAA